VTLLVPVPEVGVILWTQPLEHKLGPGIQIFEVTLGTKLGFPRFFFLFVCEGGPTERPLQDLCCLISLWSVFVLFLFNVLLNRPRQPQKTRSRPGDVVADTGSEAGIR